MPGPTVQGIDVSTLSPEEGNAFNILLNLPLDKFDQIKSLLELDMPDILGPTTLAKFLAFCTDQGLDLSANGVSAFKRDHQLGDSGVVQGVIGPQTAGVYYQVLTAQPPLPEPAAGDRQINQAGLDLVKEFEGLSLTAYYDSVHVITIGYGHTGDVQPGEVITNEQAEQLLRGDLASSSAAVGRYVTVDLTDNQFGALTSFVFNLGAGSLQHSTLRVLLNQGNYQGAADEFLRWDHAGGQVLAGLLRRRQAERALFLTP